MPASQRAAKEWAAPCPRARRPLGAARRFATPVTGARGGSQVPRTPGLRAPRLHRDLGIWPFYCARVLRSGRAARRGATACLHAARSRDCARMIHAVLLFSKQGKVRLAKFYSGAPTTKERRKVQYGIVSEVLARTKGPNANRMCSFIEWRDDKKVSCDESRL